MIDALATRIADTQRALRVLADRARRADPPNDALSDIAELIGLPVGRAADAAREIAAVAERNPREGVSLAAEIALEGEGEMTFDLWREVGPQGFAIDPREADTLTAEIGERVLRGVDPQEIAEPFVRLLFVSDEMAEALEERIAELLDAVMRVRDPLSALARLVVLLSAAAAGRAADSRPELGGRLKELWFKRRPDIAALGWFLAGGGGLGTANPGLDVLRAHLADLEGGAIDLDAAEREGRRVLGAAKTPAHLLALERDPVAEAFGRTDPDPGHAADALDTVGRGAAANWPPAPLGLLRDTSRLGPLYDDLMWAGMARTRRDSDRAGRLMLPLSVETAFRTDPSGAGHALRIRAMPDAPLSSVDPAPPEAEEVDALLDLHREMEGMPADAIRSDPQGRATWARFTALVGARRGVTLVRRFPPHLNLHLFQQGGSLVGPDAPAPDDDPVIARMDGVPRVLDFWITRRGRAPEKVARTEVDARKIAVEYADAASPRWWNDFEAAAAVGLAVDVPLGAVADDIERVSVIGTDGADGGAHLARLIEGGAPLLRHGARTNAVGAGPAADDGTDDGLWTAALLDAETEMGAVPVAAPYGLDRRFGEIDAIAVSLTWLALFGGIDPRDRGADAFAHHAWARANLRPRGPAQPLAVAGQPYGLLPLDLPSESGSLGLLRDGLLEAAGRATPPPATGDADALGAILSAGPGAEAHVIGLRRADRFDASGRSGGWQDRQRLPGATAERLVDANLPLVWDGDPAPFATVLSQLGTPSGVSDRPAPRALRDLFLEAFDGPESLFLRVVIAAWAHVDAALGANPGEGLDAVYGTAPAAPGTALAAGRTMRDDVVALARLVAGSDGAAAVADLDAAFRACLDASAYRADAIATALAHEALTRDGAPRLTVGAYGWVDAPRPADPFAEATPRMQLAPSDVQAMALALLQVGGESPALGSLEIRVCLDLAEGVAEGRTPAEVLGAMAEARLAELDPTDAHASVDALRALFPLTGETGQPPATDGLAFFSGLSSNDTPEELAAKNAFGRAHPAFFRAANTVMRHFADLMLLEGVHAGVAGRETQMRRVFSPDQGTPLPERFEGVSSGAGQRMVTTTVLLAIPDDGVVSPPGPAEAALGPLARWCAAAAPGAIDFTLRDKTGTVTLSLADLGLRPSDLALIGPGALREALEARAGDGFRLEAGPGLAAHAAIAARAELAGAPSPGHGGLPSGVPLAFEMTARLAGLAALARGLPGNGVHPLAWSLADGAQAVLDGRASAALILPPEAPVPDVMAAISSLLGDEAPVGPYAVFQDVAPGAVPLSDPDGWLGLMGAVRPRLAVADALRLRDPDALELRANRSDPFALGPDEDAAEVTVVLCPPGSDLSGRVHCAVLDRYAEGLGDADISAAATLRRLAPPARPSAALLMLPPGDWTPDRLHEAVSWLGVLARARMARPDEARDMIEPWSPQRLMAPTPAGPWLYHGRPTRSPP